MSCVLWSRQSICESIITLSHSGSGPPPPHPPLLSEGAAADLPTHCCERSDKCLCWKKKKLTSGNLKSMFLDSRRLKLEPRLLLCWFWQCYRCVMVFTWCICWWSPPGVWALRLSHTYDSERVWTCAAPVPPVWPSPDPLSPPAGTHSGSGSGSWTSPSVGCCSGTEEKFI